MSAKEDKIDEVLQECDDTCEGANYHDRVGLAKEVFDAVKKLVPEEKHLALAKKIAKAIEI